MTPAATTDLIRALTCQLRDLMTLRRQGTQHLASCHVGLWIGQWSAPNGAPCSARCAKLRALLDRADAHLAEHLPTQAWLIVEAP